MPIPYHNFKRKHWKTTCTRPLRSWRHEIQMKKIKKGDCTMWCGTGMFENCRWTNYKKCIKFLTKFHWWHLMSTPPHLLFLLIQMDLWLVQLPLILIISLCLCLMFHLKRWPKVKCGWCNPNSWQALQPISLPLWCSWCLPARQDGYQPWEKKKVKKNDLKIGLK